MYELIISYTSVCVVNHQFNIYVDSIYIVCKKVLVYALCTNTYPFNPLTHAYVLSTKMVKPERSRHQKQQKQQPLQQQRYHPQHIGMENGVKPQQSFHRKRADDSDTPIRISPLQILRDQIGPDEFERMHNRVFKKHSNNAVTKRAMPITDNIRYTHKKVKYNDGVNGRDGSTEKVIVAATTTAVAVDATTTTADATTIATTFPPIGTIHAVVSGNHGPIKNLKLKGGTAKQYKTDFESYNSTETVERCNQHAPTSSTSGSSENGEKTAIVAMAVNNNDNNGDAGFLCQPPTPCQLRRSFANDFKQSNPQAFEKSASRFWTIHTSNAAVAAPTTTTTTASSTADVNNHDNNAAEKHAEHYNIFKKMCHLLKSDLREIAQFQRYGCDPFDTVHFAKWFSDLSYEQCRQVFTWMDQSRDFIYNAHGLRLLKNRYLHENEPIQFCMMRIARLFVDEYTTFMDKGSEAGEQRQQTEQDIMLSMEMAYHAFSCGILHTSSILTDAINAEKEVIPGEACRLIASHPQYGRTLLRQINTVCALVSYGVGVGISAATMPQKGYNRNGKLHDGFKAIAKRFDSCNCVSLFERRPKVAMYIEMHNDTIYDAFELRHPLKTHLENVFVGVMIPDYFIECYENDMDWYLFSGDTTLDGKNLNDYYGDEYRELYKKFVKAKLYTKVVPSAQLIDDLVTCITETGSPYVIWSDNVNRFSNHKHLGKTKTLNLCAEITNHTTVEESSSCTLMSCNFAMFRDFPDVRDRLCAYVREKSWLDLNHNGMLNGTNTPKLYCGMDDLTGFMLIPHDVAEYVYMAGFLATWCLNQFMGRERESRELGVSPLGVYDMIMMLGEEQRAPELVGELSEIFYKACIHSSCKYYQVMNVMCKKYPGSPFSKGIPQWELRNASVKSDWTHTKRLMKIGMANSMITAQAPTATTSMLVGVIESVSMPMSVMMARESENGRNAVISYGIMSRLLTTPFWDRKLYVDIEAQVAMYRTSAPFIDQSQSTMFTLELTRQNVLNLIMATYEAQLKTSIYYTLPKQINETLNIVKDSLSARDHYEKKKMLENEKLPSDNSKPKEEGETATSTNPTKKSTPTTTITTTNTDNGTIKDSCVRLEMCNSRPSCDTCSG